MNDLRIIRRAATSDEARQATVDEIEAARAEGDHEFADGLEYLLDLADRQRVAAVDRIAAGPMQQWAGNGTRRMTADPPSAVAPTTALRERDGGRRLRGDDVIGAEP